MNNHLHYTTQVWIFSIIVAPIAITLFYILSYDSMSKSIDILETFFTHFLFGGIISILPYFILLWINKYLFIQIKNWINLKIQVNFYALALWLLPCIFLLEWSELKQEGIIILSIYAFVLTVGVWHFKIKRELIPVENEHEDILDLDNL